MIVAAGYHRPNNQAVLKPRPPLPPPEKRALTPEQEMLARNFTAALDERGAPTPGQIAEACGITEQAVSNWKRTGKITKENLRIVSAMTKWSVHRLLTGEKDPPPPPASNFADRHEVSQSDWALLQDLKTVFSPDELKAIQDKAHAAQERAMALIAARKEKLR